MGTLLGHMVPGLALICLGLWHILNTIRALYFTGSAKFTSRFWYPIRTRYCVEPLELILVLSFSIFIILLLIIDFPSFHFSFNLVNYEHATMYIHLSIFAAFTLLAELSNLSHSLQHSVSGILASSVFAQELFLLHYHSTDHVGLEGHYHWLLQLIVCVSFLAAMGATSFPTSFPASLVLSMSVVLQGCWFLIMGFVLWIPELVPLGCSSTPLNEAPSSIMHGAVICNSPEASIRARSLANLQFSWVVFAIMVLVSGICLTFPRSAVAAPRGCPSIDYEQLHYTAAEVPLTVTGFKPSRPRDSIGV